MFNSASFFFTQLQYPADHLTWLGGKKANLTSVNQTQQTKNPTLLILISYLVYLEQPHSSSFAVKYGENIWKGWHMKTYESLPACKINVKSSHSMANPSRKQVPDTNCLKMSGSTEKTSARAMQLTQVITTRSNEMTNVAISYKTTELETKLWRKTTQINKLYDDRKKNKVNMCMVSDLS